jgi:hypothetical protein
MIYDKETAHKEIRAAISAWVLDPTLPEPVIQQIHSEALPKLVGREHFLRSCDFLEFRLKPTPRAFIRVDGIKVPAPETVAPEVGDMYYVANTSSKDLYECHQWVDDRTDNRWLDAGLIYLTAENAIARSKAMLVYEVVV